MHHKLKKKSIGTPHSTYEHQRTLFFSSLIVFDSPLLLSNNQPTNQPTIYTGPQSPRDELEPRPPGLHAGGPPVGEPGARQLPR